MADFDQEQWTRLQVFMKDRADGMSVAQVIAAISLEPRMSRTDHEHVVEVAKQIGMYQVRGKLKKI